MILKIVGDEALENKSYIQKFIASQIFQILISQLLSLNWISFRNVIENRCLLIRRLTENISRRVFYAQQLSQRVNLSSGFFRSNSLVKFF